MNDNMDCPICKQTSCMQIVSASLDQSKVRSGNNYPNISQSAARPIIYLCTACQYKETRKNVGRPE